MATDPLLQTIEVGIAVCAASAAATFYLWREDRRERYLLFWATGWAINAARWGVHYFGVASLNLRVVEAIMASGYFILIAMGAYDLQRPKGRHGRPLLGVLVGLLALSLGVSWSFDIVYEVFYGLLSLLVLVLAWFFLKGFLAHRLAGFAIAATVTALQSLVFGTMLVVTGSAVSNSVIGPLTNLAISASFLLIAYERSQRRTRDAERSLRKIFDTTPIPIFMTRSPGGEVEQVNQAALDVAGLSAAELLGKTALEVGIVADPRSRQEVYELLRAGQSIVQREMVYLTGGREPRTYAVNASPLELDKGGHFLFVWSDVTELRRVQKALEELNAGLELQVAERTRDLEAFAATVSHDLRAPLRTLGGYLELLREHLGDRLDEDGRQFIATAREAATRMSAMIDDMLRFARFGRTALDLQRCDLEALVGEVVRAQASELQGREVHWRIGSLPAVTADPALLRQVLWNLISNAVKYTGRRARAEIDIDSLPPDTSPGEQVLRIRDNGAGFDPAYAARLFDVFQRLHTSREFTGNGVGLAIVERIISRHGGRVWAEGEPDKGASFYFTLPVLEAART